MLNERRDPIPELLKSVDENRLRADLFFLSKDPLPFRKLNFTRPGKNRCTLYEADDYIVAQLSDSGHHVSSQPISVQALCSNLTRPMPHQFEISSAADQSDRAGNHARPDCVEESAIYALISHHESILLFRLDPNEG